MAITMPRRKNYVTISDLDDAMLTRYSRHILLDEIGIEAQTRISSARVLIIGVGGLGCPASLYLAAAGVGKLVLCDHDKVDLTNLQRQILHATESIGMSKVDSAAKSLARLNPTIELQPLAVQMDVLALEKEVSRADVVLDCSDNFATRYAVNRVCLQTHTPLVTGAAIRFDGQISVFDFRDPNSACYHCVFPEGEAVEELRCATTGVFAPLTGIIGTMQAAETLKLIGGFGQSLAGRLGLLNALNMQWREVAYQRDTKCSVCSVTKSPAA